jgi:hypothetical protein
MEPDPPLAFGWRRSTGRKERASTLRPGIPIVEWHPFRRVPFVWGEGTSRLGSRSGAINSAHIHGFQRTRPLLRVPYRDLDQMAKVFLSYAPADARSAGQIANAIEDDGHTFRLGRASIDVVDTGGRLAGVRLYIETL